MAICYYDTSIGRLGIIVHNEMITEILFENKPFREDEEQIETAVHRQAIAQLREYLAGERRSFDLPLNPVGTEFQRQCWAALQRIPYGQTVSYQDIANAIGNPKAVRAVGAANGANPISIVIPCHRVIGKSGKLVGFGGGLPLKEKLLALEAAQLNLMG